MSLPLQMLNHTLPIKRDKTNVVLWRTQMENVIFANGFEDHIKGLSKCPPTEIIQGMVNLDFIAWRRYEILILCWLYSSFNSGYNGINCWLQHRSYVLGTLKNNFLCFFEIKNHASHTWVPNHRERLTCNDTISCQNKSFLANDLSSDIKSIHMLTLDNLCLQIMRTTVYEK